MPFKFSNVCQLLSDLEGVVAHNPPYLPSERDEELRRKTQYWFRCHRRAIDEGTVDGVALLSTLVPEKRTDRVYGLQESRLCKVIARCLHLNKGNIAVLQSWKQPGNGDLGACVQRVLKEFDCEQKPGAHVTIEETDFVLQSLASRSRFSSPAVRSFDMPSSADDQLANIFRRLSSEDAKWFTRIILKDLASARIDYALVIREYHFLLPALLRFQDSFLPAVSLLRNALKHYPSQPSPGLQKAAREEAAKLLRPKVGNKIGRQTFLKARSMQHCVNLCGSQTWSAERKYDGEYCEVHIDLSKGDQCIQIFSKSGKDSTEDRRGLHGTLRKCLRIGEVGCEIKNRCILTGELVVWSDAERKILDFYHLRKHVSRSGLFLGRDEDSQVKPGEHLMIVFYDILLLDAEMLLREPYVKRRDRLREVVRYKTGYAMPAERAVIDFRRLEHAKELLVQHFSAALIHRCEGLVLKPMDTPYFRFSGDGRGDERGYVIKLKKDYLQELGELRDVADFAVIGASYDPKIVHKSSVRNTQFTTFHIGCCINRDTAERFGELPRFEIVSAISLDQCIPPRELQALHNYVKFHSAQCQRRGDHLADPQAFDLKFTNGPESKVQYVLTEPCVVEVLGSGFERESNKNYNMLRHPRILKVHADRTWREACTFEELEALAEEAKNAPEEGETQEMSQLMKKLQSKFRRKQERDRTQLTSTPRTETTISPQTDKSISPQNVLLDRQHAMSTPTGPQRTRRSPARKSPVLIRIDTSERLPDEPAFASNSPQRPVDVVQVNESLPTPPISSANPPPSATSSGKRKALPPTVSAQVKRPHLVHSKTAPVVKDTALMPRSDNNSNSPDQARQKSARTANNAASNSFPPARPRRQSTSAARGLLSCRNASCPFSKSVIFLSTCVRGFKWVSHSLLSFHDAEYAPELGHWARDNAAVESQSVLIPESMSHPGKQKIVLVESNRLEATMACVEEVKQTHKIRDLVLFFDWRVLEDWQDVESGESQRHKDMIAKMKNVLRKRYFGFTCWSAERKEVVFMHRDLAKMPRSWLDDL